MAARRATSPMPCAMRHRHARLAGVGAAGVRRALHALQLAFRRAPGLVADGRDMGTVVFPQATLKVFLTASAASARIAGISN